MSKIAPAAIRTLPFNIQGAMAKRAIAVANVACMEPLSTPLAGPHPRHWRRRTRLSDIMQPAFMDVRQHQQLDGMSQIVLTVIKTLPFKTPQRRRPNLSVSPAGPRARPVLPAWAGSWTGASESRRRPAAGC